MTTNTPEPVAWYDDALDVSWGKTPPQTDGPYKPLYPESALQAERERAEKEGKLREETADKLVAVLRRAEKAEAELAALEVKTWNAAIEAAAEGFELDDGHYYDQVRESILRLKK